MTPDDYMRIVQESIAAVGPLQPVSETEPDQFGNRAWTFRDGRGREVEISIHPSGIVDVAWATAYNRPLPQSNEHVTVEGASALGVRIARFLKGDDSAASGPA
jgi:hypothetical protein